MRYLLADGYDQFYEVGPGRVLRGLLKRIDRKRVLPGRVRLSDAARAESRRLGRIWLTMAENATTMTDQPQRCCRST